MEELKNLRSLIKKAPLKKLLSSNGSVPEHSKDGMGENAVDKGQRHEVKALQYLKRQGLKLAAKNYRCSKGEIDLIMTDGDTIVFVEVRNRKNQNFGSPIESVTLAKQKKLSHTARHYVMTHKISARHVLRFDVVGITDHAEQPIDWVKNAFYGHE